MLFWKLISCTEVTQIPYISRAWSQNEKAMTDEDSALCVRGKDEVEGHANKAGETERKQWGLMSHTSRQELFDSRRLPMPEDKGGPTGDPSRKEWKAKST